MYIFYKYQYSHIPVKESEKVIDLKGKPLLPGFSDVHSHVGEIDLFDRPGLIGRFDTYDYVDNMKSALNWGVTTIKSILNSLWSL